MPTVFVVTVSPCHCHDLYHSDGIAMAMLVASVVHVNAVVVVVVGVVVLVVIADAIVVVAAAAEVVVVVVV